MDRLNVLSNGGGVQSTAMIVLIAQGLIPKPDLILMVDTERERSDVIAYQNQHIIQICEDMSVEYVRVKKSLFTQHDVILAGNEDLVLPGFFTTLKGNKGKQPGFCSSKWKEEVFHRYLNHRYSEEKLTKKGVNVWMGISLDEFRRVKITDGKWRKKYPLIEKRLNRMNCLSIVERFGLPTPKRSACWMCPNHTDFEWIDLTSDDFNRAVAFEKELRVKFPYLYLHNSFKTLDKVDFSTHQDSFFQGGFCDSGMCFT